MRLASDTNVETHFLGIKCFLNPIQKLVCPQRVIPAPLQDEAVQPCLAYANQWLSPHGAAYH